MGLPKASVNAGEGRHPAEKEILLEESRCGPRGHEGCIDDMIRAIKSGRRAMTDCRDNIKSLAMVFAAIKSAKEGREVLIKEIMEEQS